MTTPFSIRTPYRFTLFEKHICASYVATRKRLGNAVRVACTGGSTAAHPGA